MTKRMIYIYAVILAVLFFGGCTDQSDDSDPPTENSTWQMTYGSQVNASCRRMIQADNGGYFLLGIANEIEVPEPNGDPYLIKVDSSGNILWEKTYGSTRYDIGLGMVPTDDGGLMIVGQVMSAGNNGMDVWLIKVDSQGNRIWSNTFGGPLDEFMGGIYPTSDGGYMLGGNIIDPDDIIADAGVEGYGGLDGRSNIHLIKIDQNGEPLWSKTFESEENTIASAGTATPDGGFLICANILYFPVNDNDLLLMKVDGDGNDEWTRTWEAEKPSISAMIPTSDGNYLLSGRIAPIGAANSLECNFYFLKVRPNGNEIWNKRYGTSERFETASVLIETPDGDFIGAGGSMDIIITKLNRGGEQIWENTITTGTHNTFSGISLASDGGIVIAGSLWQNNSNIFLYKTDSDGNIN